MSNSSDLGKETLLLLDEQEDYEDSTEIEVILDELLTEDELVDEVLDNFEDGPEIRTLGFCSLGPVRVPTLTKLEPKAMYLLVVPQGMSLCNMTSVSATVWRQRGLNQSYGFP